MSVFHLSRTARRWLHSATVVLTAVTLAACGADQALSPTETALSARESASNKAALDAFVQAQGTWCDRNLPGDCDGLDNDDVGYLTFWCGDANCAGRLGMGVDFGGVNPRWWARNNRPPLPRYRYSGTVKEVKAADGRRRLLIDVRGRNTFVPVLDVQDGSFLFGAAWAEFPGNSTPGVMPELGEAAISADITLPEGYVGMPDLVQIIYDPLVFFDIDRLLLTAESVGKLRSEVNGIPAGTKVKVEGRFDLGVNLTKGETDHEHHRRKPRKSQPDERFSITVRPVR